MRQFVCVIFLKRLVVDLDLSLRAGQKQTFSRFCVFPLPTWRYFADAMGKNQGCEIRGVKIRGAKKMWSKNADADGQWHESKNARICIWETCATTRREATAFEKWAETRDAKAFQGRMPSAAVSLLWVCTVLIYPDLKQERFLCIEYWESRQSLSPGTNRQEGAAGHQTTGQIVQQQVRYIVQLQVRYSSTAAGHLVQLLVRY